MALCVGHFSHEHQNDSIIITRALLRLERTMNLLEGGDGGRVGREGGWGEREGRGGRDDGYAYCNRYVH